MLRGIIRELKDMGEISNNMMFWIFQAEVLIAYDINKASEIQHRFL